MISVIIIDSRSDVHPDWVQTAIRSIKGQTVEVELIVIDNIGRGKTIGQCWNEGVSKATNDYVAFLGDDDWYSGDLCITLIQQILRHPEYQRYSTFMTAFDEKTKLYSPIQREWTGCYTKQYLLDNPFNGKLKSGVDREHLQEFIKQGNLSFNIPYHFGYYYRKHNDYSCAGKITFGIEISPVYILCSGGRSFIDPILPIFGKKYFVGSNFNPLIADQAELIWVEWANQNAIEVGNYGCKAKKILRLHSYEAFSQSIFYIPFDKYDKVIFIAEHIKKFVESKVGEIPNAVVIPVGIDINGFDPSCKIRNNKIAYAGEISRKKGIGELFLIAKELPEYEFYIAGKFKEDDVAWWFNEKQPKNVFIEPYSYDLPKFFEDKTYILNTSLREGNPITVLEGMAHGLKPLISDWVGADEIYGKYVYKNLDDFRNLLNDYNPFEYKEFAKQYDIKKTIEKINGYLQS